MGEALPGGEPSRAGGVRILSLHLPRLPTDRLLRAWRRGSSGTPPEDRPLAIVAKIKNALRIVALDAYGRSYVGTRPVRAD